MTKIDLAGLKIDAITKKELLDTILTRVKSNQKTFLGTPYSEFLYACLKDKRVLNILNQADLAVPDGIGIFWAAKYLSLPLTAKSYWGKILQAAWQIKYSLAAIIFYPKWIKSALPEKISGSDLVWDLSKMAADNNLTIYLLGGFGETARLTSEKLSATINRGRDLNKYLRIASWSNKNPDDKSVVDEINKTGTDLLFVAYGPLKQERWIAENLPKLNVKFAVGLGGTFDYIAGKRQKPPKFVRKAGLEWLWRLITQPYRIKRIFNATFGLITCLWHYKVFTSLPIRKNAAIVILNRQNRVLVCQRNPKDFHIDVITTQEALQRKNYWQLPQGGVDGTENIVEAAKREAKEETGIQSLELIKISEKTNTYIWNNALRKFWHNRRHRNIGQIQNVVYFKFTGTDDEIKIDNHEFINYQWTDINSLPEIIHPERAGLVKIAADDLNEMLKNAII